LIDPRTSATSGAAGVSPLTAAEATTLDQPRPGLVARARAILTPQLMRFLAVGVVNTAFGFGLFALLQATLGQVWHYLVVTVISHVIAVIEAFLLQRYITFRVRGRFFGDLWRFSGVYLVVLLANLVVLPVLYDVVGLPLLLAQAIFMLATALGTFVVHRAFTFRRPAGDGALEEEQVAR
jgi:putative flippase GtrA